MEESLPRSGSSTSLASQNTDYSAYLENIDDLISRITPDGIEEDDGAVPSVDDEEDMPISLGKRRRSEVPMRSTEPSRLKRLVLVSPSSTETMTASNTTAASAAARLTTSSSMTVVGKAPSSDASWTDSTLTSRPSMTSSAMEASNNLGPIVIACSAYLRHYIERLPWGAQWEAARFVSAGFSYDRFTITSLQYLRELQTNANAAPEVARMVAREASKALKGVDDRFAIAFAKEKAVKLPWDELDKEEQILSIDPHGALGCNQNQGYTTDDPDWYGGKVHFTGKITLNKDGNLDLRLDRPVLGSSSRFMRRFGSHRFVRLRIGREILFQHGNRIFDYCRRPFVISGRVFRAFFAKEANVFLFQTNEVWKHDSITEPKPSLHKNAMWNPSLLDLIQWHNPLELNRNQTMAKWAARFALGLSNSVPGLRLEPCNIKYEKDIVCEAFTGSGKPPSEMIMTDGCGFISHKALRKLQDIFQWPIEPTAIQMRIGGAKGLLVLHPDECENESPHCVWLRDSQIKIRYGLQPLENCYLSDTADVANCTLDILRASRLTSPARLSTETIINFAENGVSNAVFVKLMQDSMRKKVQGLTTWEGSSGLYQLWTNVAHAGGVLSARLARVAAGTARAQGYIFEDISGGDDEDGLSNLDEAIEDHSTAWWDDPISGCPSSLEETVMVLLDSGFHPDNCPVLCAKLREVVKRAINVFVRKFHIDVPMSCTAFIVPDPCNVLEAGEVHIKSSRRNLIDRNGKPTDLVLGDVLVTRHPCKVPSDCQKVRAVFHERLRNYVDVIVISTMSHLYKDQPLHRHLASMTGGGDYDGDTMEAYWQPEIVEQFNNAHPCFATPPPTVQACLSGNMESVNDFLQHVSLSTPKDLLISELQNYLLGALKNTSVVGTYSTWWENAIYKSGYDHKDTIFLAYMFCAVLDGSKTGVTVSQEVRDLHKKLFAHRGPAWKEACEQNKQIDRMSSNEKNLTRDPKLPDFIMDMIHMQVHAESERQLQHIEALFLRKLNAEEMDEDLAAPWKNAWKRAEVALTRRNDTWMRKELDAIKVHVERVYSKWRNYRTVDEAQNGVGGGHGRIGGKDRAKVAFTALAIEKRQDKLRELSKEFSCGPALLVEQLEGKGETEGLLYFSDSILQRVRASYAYIYDFESSRNHWSRFPWDVAMRVLCEIKAGAQGLSKTLTEDFYARMMVSNAFTKS
ncbi:hypothetical protein AcW1_001640 [Taiwanofungus camphoratus]|nr:hypothetical protein AcV7_001497 [Antrodia cinnamomea]KAI0945407.1 hypothetical protein AcW1_001640 [Antrodia cinnamomea]